MNTLVLIRGLPGAGKTTLAKKLVETRKKCFPKESVLQLEADQYLTDANGCYHWTFERFKTAHNWCFQKTREAMEQKVNFIIVSNCFVHKSSMARYHSVADVLDYKVDTITCGGGYESVHFVPPNIIEAMKKHWEN